MAPTRSALGSMRSPSADRRVRLARRPRPGKRQLGDELLRTCGGNDVPLLLEERPRLLGRRARLGEASSDVKHLGESKQRVSAQVEKVALGSERDRLACE